MNFLPGQPFNLCVENFCVCPQLLHYLVACDHLCQLGYETALVEEALEMFQNCEAKVKHIKSMTLGTHKLLQTDSVSWN